MNGDIAHGLPVNPKLNRIRFDEAAEDLDGLLRAGADRAHPRSHAAGDPSSSSVRLQMTGQKTRSVFERYNIVSECDLVEAAKKLNTLQHSHQHQTVSGLSRRSGEAAHNSGTVSPDRGSRVRVSL